MSTFLDMSELACSVGVTSAPHCTDFSEGHQRNGYSKHKTWPFYLHLSHIEGMQFMMHPIHLNCVLSFP